MSEDHAREVWTGTLCHVAATTIDGDEALTGLLKQGTPTEPSFRALPVVAMREGLAACRRLFRDGQSVCLLGEITATEFRAIAPAIRPAMHDTVNRRTGAPAREARRGGGDVVPLSAYRKRMEPALEGLVGLA